MEGKKRNYVKQGLMQIGAGGSAGFLEVSIMHPLDLIKTRMQLQAGKGPLVVATQSGSQLFYDGIYDCFRKMYRNEGFLSFWKGIVPPILAETPKRAVKFFTFEQYKQLLVGASSSAPTPLMFALAGAGAGITEAIIINPFEVVKVSLQSDRSALQKLPSTWSVTKRIIRSGGFGLKGLNKGLTGTVVRNGVFNMVYFGFYHSVKDVIPKQDDDLSEFLKRLSIGFAAGTLASCLNIPFDVAKSRMQGPQPAVSVIKYRTLTGTLRLIYVEEGWKALYKGLVPKIMRLGPGGAIMLVVYDFAYEFLSTHFPD